MFSGKKKKYIKYAPFYHQTRTHTLKDSLIFIFRCHYKTAVTKPAVDEGEQFYDSEDLGVDLYSRWMYNIIDNFSYFYYHHFTTT